MSASVHAGMALFPPPRADNPRADPPQSRHPPGTDPLPAQTPLSPGVDTAQSRPPRSRYPPPGKQIPPPGRRLWHTVNEWPVRILLECILVNNECVNVID